MQRMPEICGVHHLKIPVRDPAVSRDFYCRVLGFEEEISFEEDGVLMGVALKDPRSGLRYAVRRDPDRAAALACFDPVAMAVCRRSRVCDDNMSFLGERDAVLHQVRSQCRGDLLDQCVDHTISARGIQLSHQACNGGRSQLDTDEVLW